MREAHITCLIDSIRIADRDQTLVRGETMWLTLADVARSADLRHAKKIGAIQINEKERARVSKPPPPPNYALRKKKPRKNVPVKAETKPVDMDALLKQAKAELMADMDKTIQAAIRAGMAEREVNVTVNKQGAEIDYDRIKAMLEAMPAQQVVVQGGTAGTATTAKKEDGPLFIPKGIVEEHKGKVEVKETASSADGLDEAAAALKAMKKKRKKDQ